MNWYKVAQSDFADRNIINEKIDTLKAVTVTLDKLAKLAFHTQTGTKEVLGEILATKHLTTYPVIQQKIEAAIKACMDSPHRVNALCKEAIGEIVKRVAKLQTQRKVLINKTMPDRWKGWRV